MSNITNLYPPKKICPTTHDPNDQASETTLPSEGSSWAVQLVVPPGRGPTPRPPGRGSRETASPSPRRTCGTGTPPPAGGTPDQGKAKGWAGMGGITMGRRISRLEQTQYTQIKKTRLFGMESDPLLEMEPDQFMILLETFR